MAIYTSLFITSPDLLQQALPHWKTPLEQPVTRYRTDQATGERLPYQDWDPDPESRPNVEAPQYEVVAVPSEDYGAYLEARALPLVRASAHRCWKGVDTVKLGMLQELLTGTTFEAVLEMQRPARIPPPSENAYLEVVPPPLVRALQRLTEPEIEAVAAKWAVTEEVLLEEWGEEQCALLVRELRSLALEQLPGQELYLMTEW